MLSDQIQPSHDSLVIPAREKVVDLYAIAGRLSDCGGKFIYEQLAGEVVYTGTPTTVSQSDFDYFLSDGPKPVASFSVNPITAALFRRFLEVNRNLPATGYGCEKCHTNSARNMHSAIIEDEHKPSSPTVSFGDRDLTRGSEVSIMNGSEEHCALCCSSNQGDKVFQKG